MRVLLGVDGSASSDLAVSLLANLSWPTGSVVEVISAYRPTGLPEAMIAATVPPFGMPAPTPLASATEGSYEAMEAQAKHLVEDAARRLAASGVTIESRTVCDRPPNAILDRAREVDADLIVLGSRGHGLFESALLGSVSAEVVDHSSRPVLIARRDRADRVILAEDGSASAAIARRALRRLPVLHAAHFRVLSVAEIDPALNAWLQGAAAGRMPDPAAAYDPEIVNVREEHEALAARSAARLRAEGLRAEGQVATGNPAHQLVEAAVGWDADLIVLGTRGRTGLKRLLLGSVARAVLQHAPCSVLIVPRRRRQQEKATQAS
jgi:nucleotide-binding universal stress UspA family protein